VWYVKATMQHLHLATPFLTSPVGTESRVYSITLMMDTSKTHARSKAKQQKKTSTNVTLNTFFCFVTV